MKETGNDTTIFEMNKQFSQSMLYQLQRDFFDKEGLNAWVRQVPFYITSNPFIANCYAEIVVAFIQDWLKAHPTAIQHPFYIMELGTGSGQFSYYVVKNITTLLEKLQLQDIQICYVMSDFTPSNIQGWQQHPTLQPWIEQGLIDFAIYDMEQQTPLQLLNRRIVLDASQLINPLMVFANYIFDTVSQDTFAIHDGRLYELTPILSTAKNNLSDNRPIDMKNINVHYFQKEINQAYYFDPDLDKVLLEYPYLLNDTALLFPIGSLRAIQYLKHLSNNNLLLIATDKGHTTLEALENIKEPAIKFHGSFSVMVNFHAIAEYFKNTGGSAFLQNPRHGIKTAVFTSQLPLKTLPRTQVAIEKYIDDYSPNDFFVLFEKLCNVSEDSSLEVIASFLQMSGWDPYIFAKLAKKIHALLENANSETIQFLANNMAKIAENYYYMPATHCVLFEIGIFFYTLKQYEIAMQYFISSKNYIGESFGFFYNIALCQFYLDQPQEALTHFKLALLQDMTSKASEEWISYLQSELPSRDRQEADK